MIDLRTRQLELQVHPDRYRAMPQAARAADASHSSLFHVSTKGGIAIATFSAIYFLAEFLR